MSESATIGDVGKWPAEASRKAGRGSLLRVGAGVWQTIVRLGATAILARRLTPVDFGLITLATLVCGLIAQLTTLAATAGIVAKKDLDQTDISTGFWLAAGVQGVLCAVTLALAEPAAVFFDTPRLTGVVRLLALQFVFGGIGAVPEALLTRRMAFGRLSGLAIVAVVFESGLAVVLVLRGYGYMGVVAGMILSSAIMHLGVAGLARWRPCLCFSRRSLRFLLRYGFSLLAETATTYLRHNLDYILVGKFFGPSVLGLYSFAYRLPNLIYTRIAIPAGSVVFPLGASLSEDRTVMAAAFTRTARYVAVVTFPLLAGLAATARPLVLLLWGDQWLAAVAPLRLLCLVAASYCIGSVVGSAFLCLDHPGLLARIGIVRLVITAVAVWAFASLYGLIGVAIGLCVAAIPVLWMIWLAYRLMGTPVTRLAAALRAPTAAAGLCAGAALAAVIGCGSATVALTVPVAVGVGAVVYVGAFRQFFPDSWLEVTAGIRGVLRGGSGLNDEPRD